MPQIKKTHSTEEKVLVFPAENLNKVGYFNGAKKDFSPYFSQILDQENNPLGTFFMSRLKAEKDENFKQIISYVLVKYDDSLLRYARGVLTSIRKNINGMYSIGFGGHVDNNDAFPLFSRDFGYKASILREMSNEIALKTSSIHSIKLIGVLNDDSSPLGKRHFAFVHLLEVKNTDLGNKEKSVNILQFTKIEDVKNNINDFEYWSKLCINTFL